MSKLFTKIAKRFSSSVLKDRGGSRRRRKQMRVKEAELLDVSDRALLLAGRQASWQLERRKRIRSLAEVEFRVSSQWGEDGILEWLVQNLQIENTRFVEFGVETYREANTRFLLQNRNWSGLIMDGSSENIETVRAGPLYWRHDLTAVSEFITAENINDLLIKHGFDGDLGVLSIDIDGNDYWILEQISVAKASILICEYNAVLGDLWPITVPYRADFRRFEAHHSGLYLGASIAALLRLAHQKGYKFIGTTSNGVNAIFVRQELFGSIEPQLESLVAYPSRFRESRDAGGRLTYVGGTKRADLISHLPLVNIENGREVTLQGLGCVYSDSWLAAEGKPIADAEGVSQ